MKHTLLLFLSALFALIIVTKPAAASEGTFDIRNVAGGNARCWAASVLMSNFEYEVLLSCRDLVYPVDNNTFNYVLWASPTDSNRANRLGTLGIGKKTFSIDNSFSELYVTEERSSSPRQPSDRVIMRGSVQPIQILDAPQLSQEPQGQPLEPMATQTPTPTVTTETDQENGGGVSAIRIIAGIVIVVVLLVIVIALISASRRRPIDI